MTHTVVAVFDDYTQAQRAVTELQSAGFEIENIRMNQDDQTGTSTGSSTSTSSFRNYDNDHNEGGIMGFFRSLFGGDDTAASHQGSYYSEAARRGHYVLSVDAESDDHADRATDILNRYNPIDIDERASQWRDEGWTGYNTGTTGTSASAFTDTDTLQDSTRFSNDGITGSTGTIGSAGLSTGYTKDSQSTFNDQASRLTGGTLEGETRIPVVQEELQVGKREVQRGGVRVFQRVIDTPVHEQVRLREEHVTIDRRPVNQPATEADLAALKDASFEMRETAEEAVIAKSARIVEEVVVGKEITERTQTVDDSVRRTEVEVERLGGQQFASADGIRSTTSTFDDDYRTHWQTNFATSGGRYEDYAPAYQFGHSMANDTRYNQYRWNDAEPDIRSSWEQQYGGTHPWDRVKTAVRHAWDRGTTK